MTTEQEHELSVRVLPDRPAQPREAEGFEVSLNLVPEAALLYGPDGTILKVNPTALKLLEADEDELIGTNIYSLGSMEPEKIRDVAAHLARGATIRFELDLLTLKGNYRRLDIIDMPVVTAEGRVESIISFARDISDLKQIESERALMAAMFESSGDAIMIVSLDGMITAWNHYSEKLFGYTQAEAIGQRFLLIVPPDKRELAVAMVGEIEANRGRVINFEGPALKKDGAVIEISMTLFGIYDRGGKLLGVSSILRDVTEHKRAEREQALLAAIVESSDAAIINLSSEAKIITWNPAAEKAYGYTAEEAIGKGVDLIVAPDQLAEAMATTRRVAETGEPSWWEQHARKRDGTPFVSAVNIFPIRDSQGKVTGVAGIARDITAMKETERQLVAAREAALAASRAKSEFLSSMSHEIRTPMTAILGMAELLAEGELNDEQRRYIEILCNNGNALLDLINSILDLAKIESGRLTLEHVDFDLRDVIEKSAQTLAIRAHAKRLELIVSIAPDVPTALVGDPLRLRQVLINLIGNAIKFTERGEVMVSVERDSTPWDLLRLKFSVRDTGIGIAKDKLASLFAAFSQADSSTARKYGGSGLGLAIVKRLVSLMQGEVALQSEVGKGSILSFTSLFEHQFNPPAEIEWPALAQMPVLVVDDNQTARAVLREMLSGWGASVIEAASYAACLIEIREACAAKRSPRIILLDDRIPSPDPREPSQLIAAASQCGASIIAMIRCDNLAADISRLRSMKLENYLVKPVELSELAKAIGRVMASGSEQAPCNTLQLPHKPADAGNGAGPPPIVERPLKILFADDSSDNRLLVRAFLKKTSYRLDEVENGRQAINAFIGGGYDLVLMDIQMPEVDGYAATRAIRDWERAHNRAPTPIIALTASVFSEAVRLTRMAGCDAHVSKPVNKATLLRAIYDVVKPDARGASAQ
ncbi:MAG: PAS domain S-box protein [Candidatus Binatus sp.]|uniref:PAS domain-containing hybrid sensor histidine kinase/response regulator n=1 Tax=Candidatus Binatus sp. TaxID=2811406 RepID=UPI002725C0C7|nr:PAS domain-containing hybrid sensor histidine kinase/response regulator [Candidatus Binatus sp.]MDO8434815.1 PAS domain S-box protein [Candidatus Binatus sp.]